MIIDYDHNPNLNTDRKLDSLKESVQMALNENETRQEACREGLLEVKEAIADMLQALKPEIVVEEYDLGVISFSAGSVGTTATTIDKAVTKEGYDPICLAVRYQGTNVVGFRPFFSQDKSVAYTQIVRGQTSAFSTTVHAYLIVTYKAS